MTRSEVNAPFIWMISLTVACGGFLFGYDWVVVGGAKPFYEVYFSITDPSVSGFVMGSALIGCIIGSMAAGVAVDKFGRKYPLLIAAILFVISALGSAIADTLEVFVLYRILGGIGIGLASTISPMYIAEVSPAESRGKMVAINQLTIVLGILAAQIINLLIADPVPSGATPGEIIDSWNGQAGWRYMFAVEAIPAALFFLLMLFVPESPRWLCKVNKQEQAKKVLKKLGSEKFASASLTEINSSFVTDRTNAGLNDAKSLNVIPVLIIGIVLAAFQQWSGINVVFNYAQEVFASAGFDINDTLKSIVATGLINLVFTVIALPLVDKVGRRRLMLIGSLGLVVVYVLIAMAYTYGVLGIPVLVLVLCGIGIYACTLAPVTWVLLSEIFPNRIRGSAMSACTFTLWVASFLLTFTFPILNHNLGAAGSFLTYAIICAAGFLFIYTRVPETKALSLEEVEQRLTNSPGNSLRYTQNAVEAK